VEGGLTGFVRDYGEVAKDLEAVEKKRVAVEADEDKVDRADKQKQAEIAREKKAIDSEEAKLLGKERDILNAAKPPERPAGAVRMGGRGAAQRDRGGRAGGAGGAGGGAADGGAGAPGDGAGGGGAGGGARGGRNGG
jgi:hypothetical protein